MGLRSRSSGSAHQVSRVSKAGWPVDVFVPNMMAHIASPGLDMLSRDSARLDLIGQLKPGRTLEEARAEMRGLASQLEAAHAESRDSAGLSFSSLKGIHPEARPSAARFAQLLAATVTCLLVIACANLAGLLLARNTTRHKEIAMRLALGAGRGRIVRQLLFESVLLSVCGGVVGLLFASWGNVLLASYYGTEIDGVRHSYALTIDRAAFLLTMAVATATGIAFGLLPAVTRVAHGADSGAQEGRRLARLPPFTLWGRVSCRASLNLGRAGHRRRSLDSQRSNAPFGSRFRCRARCLLSNEATPERLRSRESVKLFPQSAAPPRIAWRGGIRRIRPVPTDASAWRRACRSFYQAMHHQRRTKRSVSRSILSRLDFSRRWPYQSSGAEPSMTAILNRAGNLLSSIRSWLRGCGLIPIPSVRLCSSKHANSAALMRSPTKSLEWRSTKAFAPAAQHLARLFSAPIGRPPPDQDACWCV